MTFKKNLLKILWKKIIQVWISIMFFHLKLLCVANCLSLFVFVFLCSGLTKVHNFGIPTLTNKSCVMQSKNVRLAMFLLTVSCIIDEKSCDVNDARFLKYAWPFFITGKTHVLSHIKYYILQRKLIQKELILLITFQDHKNILTWKKQTPAATSTIISDQVICDISEHSLIGFLPIGFIFFCHSNIF